MLELLKGLRILKNMGIFHRDIKPHNFLYNINDKKGIIIDFGLAEIDTSFYENVVKKKHKEYIQKASKK